MGPARAAPPAWQSGVGSEGTAGGRPPPDCEPRPPSTSQHAGARAESKTEGREEALVLLLKVEEKDENQHKRAKKGQASPGRARTVTAPRHLPARDPPAGQHRGPRRVRREQLLAVGCWEPCTSPSSASGATATPAPARTGSSPGDAIKAPTRVSWNELEHRRQTQSQAGKPLPRSPAPHFRFRNQK